MENNTENNQGKNNIFIYLLVVFLAIFFGTGIFLFISNSKTKQGNETAATSSTIKEEKMIIPTEMPVNSSLLLSTAVTPVKLNNNFIVNVTANSGEKNIVGYDLILYYDPSLTEFVKAESLLPGFQIYTYKHNNYVVITAVKGLQNESLSVFSENKILSFTFRGLKIGKGSLSLKNSSGNEKTKLVTDKTESLNPKLNDLQIEIN
jgi:hypothetical protein